MANSTDKKTGPDLTHKEYSDSQGHQIVEFEVINDIRAADLSTVDNLIFRRPVSLIGVVKLPKKITIESQYISNINTKKIKLSSKETDWISSFNPSNFSVFPTGDFNKTGVKEIFVKGYTLYFPAGIVLPKGLALKGSDESLDICGHIPDGTDFSNFKDITILQLGSLGQGVKFPKNVSLALGSGMSIPDNTDLSSIENLKIIGTVKFGKNVKLPKNMVNDTKSKFTTAQTKVEKKHPNMLSIFKKIFQHD